MLTVTSLKHPSVATRMQSAMVKTAKLGFPVWHLYNRKGDAFLACRYIKLGQDPSKPSFSGFQWTNNKGEDITKTVTEALRT